MYMAFQAPNKSTTVTKSDTVNQNLIGYLVADANGVVVCQLASDTADVTLPVIAGLQYWGEWKLIKATNTTAGNIVVLGYKSQL